MPPCLSEKAQRQLEDSGSKSCSRRRSPDATKRVLALADGSAIVFACVLWAAGVMASKAAKWLGVPADRAGRVMVDERLNPRGIDNIFVIGDTAAAVDEDGGTVPGIAPAAKQMGRYAARAILARIAGNRPVEPFRYRDFGNLATIGRKAAVADFGRIRLSGFPAWLVWSFAHLWFLVGFRNRSWCSWIGLWPISATIAAPVSSPTAMTADLLPRVKMGRAVTALLLLAVLSTAALVHLIWHRTASPQMSKWWSPLDAQSAGAVRNELASQPRTRV